jgi:AraC-like DNA-binding protein
MRIRYTNIDAQYMDTPSRRMLDLRGDGLPEIPLLGWHSYSRARPDLPLHRHAGCLEIHFRQRGEQAFQLGDRLHRLQGGDLFVTLPDEVHSSGGYPCGPGVMYCLNVRKPNPGRGLLGLSAADSRLLFDRFAGLPDRRFRAGRTVKPLWDELFRLHDGPEIFLQHSRMRTTMLRLLLAVLDSSLRHADQSLLSQRIADIVEKIRDIPEREYRLDELARETHLSLARFKGRFKAETGVSPWQFILQTKIEAAQRRLRGADESITSIAMSLGFVSSQYFATVFKRITGQTPRDYRNSAAPIGPSTRRDDGQAS